MRNNLISKKAVSTAAGFVGFFGYVGRVIQGKGMGWVAQHYGWNAALWSVVACTVLGIILSAFLWNVRRGAKQERATLAVCSLPLY